MKLTFCVFRYFPFGGLQKDMRRIAETCLDRGHDVRILTGEWTGDEIPGCAIEALHTGGWSNHRRDARLARAMADEIARMPADAVIGFNKMPGLDWYYAADSCFAAKVYEDRPWPVRCLPRYRHYLAFERAVFDAGQTTHLLMISPAEQGVYQRYYGTEPERFTLLPPGIERDRVAGPDAAERRRRLRESQGLRDDERLVLLVGSGFRTKGLDRAIRALAALSDTERKHTRLWVIGQDRPGEFEALARRLGVGGRVRFLGGRDDVPDFLLGADLLIHPAYRENTGTVLLEAMVAGLPVLTTDVCGYAHYVTEYAMGTVLPSPFVQADLDLALSRLLAQPRAPWRERGRAFAERADIFAMPTRAVEAIEQRGAVRGTLA